MKQPMIKQLLAGEQPENIPIQIKGWVRTRRDSKGGFSFIALSDGSCFAPIQIVANNTLANYDSEILHLTAGCSINVSGSVVRSQGKGQGFEIQAERIEVIGWVENPESYPISPKHHSMEYLRTVAHLRPRTNTFGAVTRLRHHLSQAIHRFFSEQGFYWVNTPIITASDCEGAGELFRVSTLDLNNLPRNEQQQIDYSKDFFGKEAFLTVSGQLNVESYCLALSKVYTFGPTFRAENSNTSRHLAEFWMVEPEVAFADLNDIACLAEAFLKYVLNAALTELPDDMDFFANRVDKNAIQRIEHVLKTPFEKIDYGKTIELLQNSGKKFDYPVTWGLDLQSEHERYLCEELVKGPVIVTNYPEKIKAFYMRLNDDQKTCAAMDILVPGIGEIIGGSQREDRLDVLKQRMQQFHIVPEQLDWYLDLRRYGSVPHAGFGLGFERLINYVTGLDNIRDAIPFPRTPKHALF
ncbi:MAG TPA: asparagine--tRNA ligase [Pseudomonadales bacterium]|nr:asparagine--tRNA ligase [Pseudomonadales bacterium]